jgi:hypothetical protein
MFNYPRLQILILLVISLSNTFVAAAVVGDAFISVIAVVTKSFVAFANNIVCAYALAAAGGILAVAVCFAWLVAFFGLWTLARHTASWLTFIIEVTVVFGLLHASCTEKAIDTLIVAAAELGAYIVGVTDWHKDCIDIKIFHHNTIL